MANKIDISSLVKEVASSPNPINMVTLIEKYIATGDIDNAIKVASDAINRFPDSEKVVTVYQNAKKVKLAAQISKLHSNIEYNPRRTDYEALALLYNSELNNKNKAFEVAIDGLRKFPNSDGLHLVSGDARMERFHKNFLSSDFREAVKHYERAIELNPLNYKALLYLGRIYSEIGLYKKGAEILLKALQLNPADEKLEWLMKTVNSKTAIETANIDDTLQNIERSKKLGPIGCSILQMFEHIPAESHFNNYNIQDIQKIIDDTKYEDVKHILLMLKNGKVIAKHTSGDTSNELLVTSLRNIYNNAEESLERMDLGSFTNGEIETPQGNIYISKSRDILLCIIAEQTAIKGKIYNIIERVTSCI
ncbi:MAG: hypothetical protein A2W05_05065 [Candidatus Schekmanbacteria bacterium RBG_16_38_10]|uniref:Roadblock/LAMTOR2 domain-containing protein n=1 Tax=Candidatus Schekmanbacteria bacterium RBG_16_38_10 TaxID=1817879 RepID=A0A1F7RPS2_9BACT|nr:MAG: hypothetical protein A2W05_05065 [Candidatus Schekmanbacteria bacterium RBG_16_38_10]